MDAEDIDSVLACSDSIPSQDRYQKLCDGIPAPLAGSEHLYRLIVHLVQYGAFEHITDDRSASMAVRGKGAMIWERNAERSPES